MMDHDAPRGEPCYQTRRLVHQLMTPFRLLVQVYAISNLFEVRIRQSTFSALSLLGWSIAFMQRFIHSFIHSFNLSRLIKHSSRIKL